jgi:hypothetical protein
MSISTRTKSGVFHHPGRHDSSRAKDRAAEVPPRVWFAPGRLDGMEPIEEASLPDDRVAMPNPGQPTISVIG